MDAARADPADIGGGSQPSLPVPGVVTLVTASPIEIPPQVGWTTVGEQLEDRPWLLGVVAAALLALVLAWRRSGVER